MFQIIVILLLILILLSVLNRNFVLTLANGFWALLQMGLVAGLLYLIVHGNALTELNAQVAGHDTGVRVWPLLIVLFILWGIVGGVATYLIRWKWSDVRYMIEVQWQWLGRIWSGAPALIEALKEKDSLVFGITASFILLILQGLAGLWLWNEAIALVDRKYRFGDGQLFVAAVGALAVWGMLIESWKEIRCRFAKATRSHDASP